MVLDYRFFPRPHKSVETACGALSGEVSIDRDFRRVSATGRHGRRAPDAFFSPTRHGLVATESIVGTVTDRFEHAARRRLPLCCSADMKTLVARCMFVVVFAIVALVANRLEAQGLSESTGVSQYFVNCAKCHESTDVAQAPRTSVLKQMPPERIYESLATGTMRTQAAHLSDQEKRLIAEWVGGRKIDTDLAGAAEKMTNRCTGQKPVRMLAAAGWNGWGVDQRNSRFQSGPAAGLSPGQVSRLTLKWAFGFPGATALYGQAAIDGRLYVTSNAGYVYSLDAETGCVHWSFRSEAVVRSGFTIGRMSRASPRLIVYFGDIHGTVYALDATTGDLIWKVLTDPHPLARITGTPVLHDNRLYVPVASLEEPESGQADYACCTFRGFLAALDAATGEPIWKTYTIAEQPKVVGRNSRGKDMLAPSGAGIWVTPVLDVKRRALYFGTGNAFSGTPQTANAIMAVHMDTGKVLWSMQALPLDVWHNGCPQTIPGGRAGGRGRGGAGAIPYPAENCPNPTGPDWDFSAPPALATTTDGRDIIIAPQKQGLVWALNPDNGAVLWKQDVAREIAGGRGETLFGGAVDNHNAYFGLVSGAHLALDLKTGEEVWYSPITRPSGRENKRGIVGAVTLIPGVLLSGAGDGVVRAVSSKTGQLLWQFDTVQDFKTVNGVAARGGSLASGGPLVVNGMVFIGSGYPGFQGGDPGNVLVAFAPTVRLDAHADEMKKRVNKDAPRKQP
jgi:polyvinyl alcohol dehydrogenase (cytochrome)